MPAPFLARASLAALVGLGSELIAVDAACTDTQLSDTIAQCQDAGDAKVAANDACGAMQDIVSCYTADCCAKGLDTLKTMDTSLMTSCPSISCDAPTAAPGAGASTASPSTGSGCSVDDLMAASSKCQDMTIDANADACQNTQLILNCYKSNANCCEKGFDALKTADPNLGTTCPSLSCHSSSIDRAGSSTSLAGIAAAAAAVAAMSVQLIVPATQRG